MPAKGKIALNLNIDPELIARVDAFRFRRMFPTRTQAIEALLNAGLKVNPAGPGMKTRGIGNASSE